MTDVIRFSDDLFDALRGEVHATKQEAEQTARVAERAKRCHEAWSRLFEYASKQWLLHAADLINREKVLLSASGDDRLASAVEQIRQAARCRLEQIRRTFPSELEAGCRKAELPIDAESRHPRYRFKGGFFRLDIDEQRGVAKLSDHESRLDEFPADIPAILEAVLREHKRLFERPIDPDTVLKKLRTQYLAILRKDEKPDGEAVPIRRITQRLGKNEKGFRTDEFLVDVSVLAESGSLHINGRRLDLQQTRNPEQGMLLIGGAGRGYVGFVSFRKESSSDE